METVSSQPQQERHRTRRLEQELAAARELPRTHQHQAYRLRKRLRAVLAVLHYPHWTEKARLKRIAQIVAGTAAGEEDPPPAGLA